jgi:hypothetical protein
MRKLFSLTLLLVALSFNPALAQVPGVSVDIEPVVGLYIPFTKLVEEQNPELGNLIAEQKEAFAIGGRLSVLFAGPVGVEGNFMYAFSDVDRQEDGQTTKQNGYVWIGDARLLFNIVPGPINFFLTGGMAWIGRGGDAYDRVVDGKTNVGAVFGVGVKVSLGQLAFRGDAQGYRYNAQLTVNEATTGIPIDLGEQTQYDVVMSAGVSFSFF